MKPESDRQADSNRRPTALGFLESSRKYLGLLNIVAAVLLFYFAISGFLEGLVFLPFGFGIMALYFFYAYMRNTLGVNFGKATVPFNLLLLFSALLCLVIGMLNKS